VPPADGSRLAPGKMSAMQPQFIGWLVLGYLLGSIPFGLLLTRAAGLGDIRSIGSGNIGATNVLRTGNRKLALATLLLDAVKGAVAVLLAVWLSGTDAGLIAGGGAVLGHTFPLWLGFRGGKGVATAFGVLLAIAWWIGLLAGAVWILLAGLTRISAAGALAAFAAAPILAAFLARPEVAGLAAAIALLVFIRHAPNIRRLIAGTEPRIGKRGSGERA
jgi:glycerol-3-phosphate acyltransferase PlsY